MLFVFVITIRDILAHSLRFIDTNPFGNYRFAIANNNITTNITCLSRLLFTKTNVSIDYQTLEWYCAVKMSIFGMDDNNIEVLMLNTSDDKYIKLYRNCNESYLSLSNKMIDSGNIITMKENINIYIHNNLQTNINKCVDITKVWLNEILLEEYRTYNINEIDLKLNDLIDNIYIKVNEWNGLQLQIIQ